jgi:dihydrofolate reductase
MIIGIIAIARNYAIGKDGKLPWHYPADLKHFKRTTTGHAMVMGASTWSSIGKPLPNRLSVVLSRSIQTLDHPNALLIQTKDQALELCRFLGADLFIIGGAKTYETFADSIDEWIVTRVPIMVEEPFVAMPRNFLDGFSLQSTGDIGEGLSVEVFRRDPN